MLSNFVVLASFSKVFVYLSVESQKIMRKTLLTSLITCVFAFSGISAFAQISICAGQSATIVPTSTLSGTSNYTLSTGSGTFTPNTNGNFVVSPLVTTIYTITAANTNTSYNYPFTVTVNPQPVTSLTVGNYGCNTFTNSWNLNLTFLPSNPAPQYTITWGEPASTPGVPNVPPDWQNNQTSMSGTVVPGSYTAIVTANGGCTDTVVIDILPPPAPAEFSLSPSGPNYSLTCVTKSIEISAHASSALTYTFNNSSVNPITSSVVVVTASNVGTWTITAEHPVSGCIKTSTFSLGQNTVIPTSNISNTFQTIDCQNPAQTITLTAISPTVNFTHFVYSSQQATFVANSHTVVYPPGPGTHTYVFLNNVNGCRSTKVFTIATSGGLPSFGLNSAPAGYTLGCGSKSITTITFTNAQTNPTPGGAISYTIVPLSNTVQTGNLSTNSSYTFNTPGQYKAVVRDNSNQCDSEVPFTIITRTVPPALDSVWIPTNVLDCANPQTIIEGFADSENVSYTWSFPTSQGATGQLTSKPFTVNINTFVPPTTTLIATYTLTLRDNNNLCASNFTVPMYQNLFPPRAFAAPSENAFTCATQTIVLSNFSESRVPAGGFFTTGRPVEATLWQGPSPQLPLQNSSTYTATIAGDYTMTVVDRNNGCTSTTIIPVDTDVEYPLLTNSNSVKTIDCGFDTTRIAPILQTTTVNLSYTWTAAPQTTIGNEFGREMIAYQPGVYTVTIRNNSNQCVTVDSLRVTTGSLSPAIDADRITGYAPLTVNFTNNSISSSGNSSITTLWSFDVDSVLTTESASLSPSMVYNQPGNYTVTAYVQKGKCIDTAYAYITVELPSEIIVPNVFSPNGDGVNDLFHLQRSSNLSNISAKIFDRWGNIVYELTTDKGNIEWDGKNQAGVDVPQGTYLYVITATGRDGGEYDLKGTLTLVR